MRFADEVRDPENTGAIPGGEASAPDWRAATALATHPRIAERARAAGFGRVVEAAPTIDAIVHAMQTVAGPAR